MAKYIKKNPVRFNNQYGLHTRKFILFFLMLIIFKNYFISLEQNCNNQTIIGETSCENSINLNPQNGENLRQENNLNCYEEYKKNEEDPLEALNKNLKVGKEEEIISIKKELEKLKKDLFFLMEIFTGNASIENHPKIKNCTIVYIDHKHTYNMENVVINGGNNTLNHVKKATIQGKNMKIEGIESAEISDSIMNNMKITHCKIENSPLQHLITETCTMEGSNNIKEMEVNTLNMYDNQSLPSENQENSQEISIEEIGNINDSYQSTMGTKENEAWQSQYESIDLLSLSIVSKDIESHIHNTISEDPLSSPTNSFNGVEVDVNEEKKYNNHISSNI